METISFIGSPVTLTASWPGNYAWGTGQTTRSISFTPAAAGTTNYSVSDGQGCITDQFTVIVSAPLPVTLINFDVKENNNGNYISWQTENESNNRQFIISRSADGIHFEVLAKVPASPTPNQRNKYRYVDTDPLYPASYYKLEQEDLDGNKRQLGIRKISGRRKTDLALYAQPSSSGLVIKVRSEFSSTITLSIYNTQGKQYKYEVIKNLQGSATRKIDLNPGLYICEIKNDKGRKLVSKVMVR